MATMKFQANYQELGQVAQKFSQQANQVQQMMNQIRSNMENLQNSWSGKGSEAFFGEMNDQVIPGINRLQQAMEHASQSTGKMAQTIRQAEEEASGLFKFH
jgi:WXG100 family type VII secretion target